MSAPLAESDTPRLRAIAATDRPLEPHECAERARLAAALIEPGRLDRSGPGEAVLLWRDEHSEAWLNLWWQPRDTRLPRPHRLGCRRPRDRGPRLERAA